MKDYTIYHRDECDRYCVQNFLLNSKKELQDNCTKKQYEHKIVINTKTPRIQVYEKVKTDSKEPILSACALFSGFSEFKYNDKKYVINTLEVLSYYEEITEVNT